MHTQTTINLSYYIKYLSLKANSVMCITILMTQLQVHVTLYVHTFIMWHFRQLYHRILYSVNHGSLHIHSQCDVPQECEHHPNPIQFFFWPLFEIVQLVFWGLNSR